MDLPEHLPPDGPTRNAEPKTLVEPRMGKRWTCGFLVWFAAVSAGIGALVIYSAKPTPHARAAAHWPTDSALAFASDRFTLLMFVHPGCSCSVASLGELEVLVARSGGQVDARVIFLHEDRMTDDRTARALRDTAARIPGVGIVGDPDGTEARRFGAGVSGDTFVFDTSGVLRFRGGITAARGHAGANTGRLAIEEMTHSGVAAVSETPVFGCALFDRKMPESYRTSGSP